MYHFLILALAFLVLAVVLLFQIDGTQPSLPEPEDLMRAWSVSETARFLQQADLEGPAEACRVSGVNGADLLDLSTERLCSEIRLTRFAAAKVVAARTSFLAAR